MREKSASRASPCVRVLAIGVLLTFALGTRAPSLAALDSAPPWTTLDRGLEALRASGQPLLIFWGGEGAKPAPHWIAAELEDGVSKRVAESFGFVRLQAEDFRREWPESEEAKREREREAVLGRPASPVKSVRDVLRLVSSSPAVVIIDRSERIVRRFDEPEAPRGARASRELDRIAASVRAFEDQKRTIDALLAEAEEKLRAGDVRGAVQSIIPWEEPKRQLLLEPALVLRIGAFGTRLRERAEAALEPLLGSVAEARTSLVRGNRGPLDRAVETLQKAILELDAIGREHPFPDVLERVRREKTAIISFLDFFGAAPGGPVTGPGPRPGAPPGIGPGQAPR